MDDDVYDGFGDRPIGEFAVASPLASGTQRELSRFLRRVLRQDPIPGLSVAVVRPDGEAYTDAVGSRDLAGNRAVSPDTLYPIGSVSKSITATAVLQLADAGMLSLDDPITDHLDFDIKPGASDGPQQGETGSGEEPVRIHHLLTHTSGYPSLGVSEALIARRTRRGEPGIPLGDREDFHAHVADAWPERTAPPGDGWQYCNTGYCLLGEIVEGHTGVAFSEYVNDHVFTPLGMQRATFDDGEFARDADAATPYLIDEGELTPASLPTREVSYPAGGVLTSVREVGTYLRCQLQRGSLDGTQLLPTSRSDQLHEGRVDTPAGSYGYGWRTREVCGQTVVGHSGSVAVSSAYAGFAPEADLAVAVAANSSPEYPLRAIGEAVLAIALGERPVVAVPFWQRRRLFARLTGRYVSYRGVKPAAVFRDGGTLRVEYGGPLGGGSVPLRPDGTGSESETKASSESDSEPGPQTGTGTGSGSETLNCGDPTALSDGDVVTFTTLPPDGTEATAEFRFSADGIDLLVDRWHLHKVRDDPLKLDADRDRSVTSRDR